MELILAPPGSELVADFVIRGEADPTGNLRTAPPFDLAHYDMSDQRQKKQRFLSVLSSPFRALRSRPPSPNNAVQAGVSASSTSMQSSATPECLTGSRTLPRIDDSETVNESTNQRPDQNTPNPQR